VTTREPLLDPGHAIVERVPGRSRMSPDSGPGTPLSGAGYWLDSAELRDVVVACESEVSITFDPRQDLTSEG
jgi:hypothetical protein